MRNTQIQQLSNRRRRRRGGGGCLFISLGLIIVIGLAIVLLLPALPGIGLQVLGFEPVGRTDDVLASETSGSSVSGGGGGVAITGENASDGTTDNANSTTASVPGVQFAQASRPASVFVNAQDFGTYNINADEATIHVGTDASGRQMLTLQITETQALAMCMARMRECAPQGAEYNGFGLRNLSVDFRSGGVIVNGEAKVPSTGIWQEAGGVLKFNNSTKNVDVLGVDMDGTLYRAPEEFFGMSFDEMVTEANRALDRISVTANGTTFRLSEVYMGDDAITLVLR